MLERSNPFIIAIFQFACKWRRVRAGGVALGRETESLSSAIHLLEKRCALRIFFLCMRECLRTESAVDSPAINYVTERPFSRDEPLALWLSLTAKHWCACAVLGHYFSQQLPPGRSILLIRPSSYLYCGGYFGR